MKTGTGVGRLKVTELAPRGAPPVIFLRPPKPRLPGEVISIRLINGSGWSCRAKPPQKAPLSEAGETRLS